MSVFSKCSSTLNCTKKGISASHPAAKLAPSPFALISCCPDSWFYAEPPMLSQAPVSAASLHLYPPMQFNLPFTSPRRLPSPYTASPILPPVPQAQVSLTVMNFSGTVHSEPRTGPAIVGAGSLPGGCLNPAWKHMPIRTARSSPSQPVY